MRVSTAREPGKEAQDEAEAAFAGTDHCQASRGGRHAGRSIFNRSDVELVRFATERTPEECRFFFKELREEASQEGWESMKGVILPKLREDQLSLRPLPWGVRNYRASYSDVTFRFLLPSGDEITATGNKSWTIREVDNGKWIALPMT